MSDLLNSSISSLNEEFECESSRSENNDSNKKISGQFLEPASAKKNVDEDKHECLSQKAEDSASKKCLCCGEEACAIASDVAQPGDMPAPMSKNQRRRLAYSLRRLKVIDESV